MDTRKTVLLVTPGAQTAPGGIAKIVDYTMRGWPKNSNFRLRIVDTYGTAGVIRMPFYFPVAVLKVLYALMFSRVQVLHLNMSERLSVWRKLFFATMGMTFGVPVVVHMHGATFADYFEALPPWRQHLIQRVMRSCSTVLVLGSFWKEFAAKQLTIPDDRIRILYNAVPVTAEQTKNIGGDCRILFLGFVGERKGVDTLLAALAHPSMSQIGGWQAIIGGNGEIARFEAVAAKLGISDRVKFPGLLDEAGVKGQLIQADIFVLPSRNEGLPVAILEAMSYACAIVSTPVGSIRDAIIPEETGLLIDVGDHEGLAAALVRLVNSRELRSTLGAGAKAKFQASFALPYYVAELESVYESVTVRADSPPGVRYQA